MEDGKRILVVSRDTKYCAPCRDYIYKILTKSCTDRGETDLCPQNCTTF